MELNFDDFNFDAMPEKDDAAGWVSWFSAALQALIKLIASMFSSLKNTLAADAEEE